MDNGVNSKGAAETNDTAQTASSVPWSDLIGKVLQNPELLTLVASALGGSKNGSENKTSDEEPQAQAASSEPTEDNPAASAVSESSPTEALQESAASNTTPSGSVSDFSSLDFDKLPEMVAAISPLLSGFAKPQGGGHHGHGGPPGHHKHHPDNKTTLLHAIKPYLSPERREAIDYMIKFGKLAEIFKGFY